MRLFSSRPKDEGVLSELVKKTRSEFRKTNSWDDLWRKKLTPWDLGKATPVLSKELETSRRRLEKSELVSSLTTLVPGCGAGYDLVAMLKHHDSIIDTLKLKEVESTVVGLDISPTSLDAAQALLESDGTVSSSQTTQVLLKHGDFFSDINEWETWYSNHESRSEGSFQTFDLIFDYTFFCAFPHNLRNPWGKRIAELLTPESGRLLTLIYPIVPDAPREEGPPYPVTVDDYRSVLEPHGVLMDSSEPYESPFTVPHRQGKELIAFWKREGSKSKL